MESVPSEKTKILYVEDNPVNMALVKRLLSGAGYDILQAGTGMEGIKVAKEQHPALILMDINLPDMGGHEASTKIKGIDELKNIPIVALTANVMPGDREMSLAVGCDGYISKPIDVRNFIAEVEKYLGGRREHVDKEEEPVYLREYSMRLVDSLEEKIEKLGRLNEGLEKRVAERTVELETANAELEEKNRALESKQKIIEESQRELEEVLIERTKKKVELEKTLEELGHTQGQLLQSEKMASIGQLAAGVAHEINNPIAFIGSNVGILGEYIEEFKILIGKHEEGCDGRDIEEFKESIDYEFLLDDAEKVVNETIEGAERVAAIVENLKTFSHVDHAEREYMDINRGIDSTLNVANNEIKYKARIIKEYGEIPKVECYPQQINQVFMNLLVNASQAIEDKGEIRIKSCSSGDKVFVEISDTGSGMSPEVLKRIFEPFYTTKPIGKGTGLGLSISYGIINRHGGNLSVESEEGKGSSFKIELPIGG